MDLPESLSQEMLVRWREYRAKDTSRKKWTPRMEDSFIEDCVDLHDEGYDVNKCCRRAMQSGWLVPYPRDEYKRKKRPSYHTNTQPAEVVPIDRENGLKRLREAKGAIK